MDSEQLLLIQYLKICLDPYKEFSNSKFDFHQFYESLENLTQEELLHKFKYNWLTNSSQQFIKI